MPAPSKPTIETFPAPEPAIPNIFADPIPEVIIPTIEYIPLLDQKKPLVIPFPLDEREYFQVFACDSSLLGDSKAVGWHVGDPIDNLTTKGNDPSWSAARSRFWKNQANNNPGNYTEENLFRMRRGLAPQRYNPATGQMESKELHYSQVPQRESIENGEWNLEPLWPEAHAAKDAYRHLGGK